ncbi:MAG: hypothetical protein EOO85_27410 [Pedobacter sp.]|nr:MAG: hypothetical protein EOO85_27410 [Pedobacter sp.]
MSLICISGHQGTGKSTILNELAKLGYIAYGLDEEKVAGYFNTRLNNASTHIPQGLDRNLEWRKDNVWRVDINKLRALSVAKDNKPTFYCGYASNIEELWDICDEIIILQLSDDATLERLQQRTNNSFGKHPGELELATANSKIIDKKAKAYKNHRLHFIDGSLDVQSVVSKIIEITDKNSEFIR